MQWRPKTYLAGFSLWFGLLPWQAPLGAESSAEAVCEKLYSNLLNRAKQALNEGTREEALRFLVEAVTVAEQCASSLPPYRRQRTEGNVLASAPDHARITGSVL